MATPVTFGADRNVYSNNYQNPRVNIGSNQYQTHTYEPVNTHHTYEPVHTHQTYVPPAQTTVHREWREEPATVTHHRNEEVVVHREPEVRHETRHEIRSDRNV